MGKGQASIIPIDRRRGTFLTQSGLYAVREALTRAYRAAAGSDWPELAEWLQGATRGMLDIAIKGTAIGPDVAGTVDIRTLPTGEELVFVASELRAGVTWQRAGLQLRPQGILCED